MRINAFKRPGGVVAGALPLAAPLLLAGCGGGGGGADPAPVPPPKAVIENITREWGFTEWYKDGHYVPRSPGSKLGFGVVDESQEFFPKILFPDDLTQNTIADVYSSELGGTYWVRTEAPGQVLATDPIGTSAHLETRYYYKKSDPNATLSFVVSNVFLEGLSGIPSEIDNPCGVRPAAGYCKLMNEASFNFLINAYWEGEQKDGRLEPFFVFSDIGALGGWQLEWEQFFGDGPISSKMLFNPNLDNGLHATLELATPVRISVPIGDIPVGETFEVLSLASVEARNGIQGEFYMGAYFRDPVTQNVAIETVGLDPAPAPSVELPLAEISVCAGAPNAAAGIFELDAPEVDAGEHNRVVVGVTRVGGSEGTVSVTVSTQDETAVAGVDYVATRETVVFPDGDASLKRVSIPIVGDSLVEPEETFALVLEDPRGCAALGAVASATVTILDDDAAAAHYSVGGTVAGLTGSGLVLSNSGGDKITVGNGAFAFPTPRLNGSGYNVAVDTQPSGPTQLCTVANGSGTIQGADVTDVEVICAAPAPTGALDPAFNVTGKVATNAIRAGKAIALQSDGKLVVLGDLNALARYNADGTPDTSFGTGGVVEVTFNTASDNARAIAVQADDKIVAVGRARSGVFDDFGVARYDADGALDASFGNAGKLSLDLNGSYDDAKVVLIQPDGKIVIAGNGGTAAGAGVDTDFAVVRLESSGALDTSFDGDGKASVNLAGAADLVNAAALQADGQVLVGGRVGVDGGATPDLGLVRFGADGALDTGFNGSGSLRLDLSGNGDADEITGLAVQSDGKIVASVQPRIGGVYVYGIERVNADGTPDTGFGSNGLVTHTFATGGDFARAIAVDALDRIVTVGYTRTNGATNDDFLITRHTGDGALDASFADAGVATTDFFATADGAQAVLLQGDGKIVAAGSALNGTINGLAIVRVLP